MGGGGSRAVVILVSELKVLQLRFDKGFSLFSMAKIFKKAVSH